jgi:hypothetical protein
MFDLTSYVVIVRTVVSRLRTGSCMLFSSRGNTPRGGKHPDRGAGKHPAQGRDQNRRIASTIHHAHRRKYVLAVVIVALILLVIAGLAADN